MELRELVFSKEPYEMLNVGTAAVMALFDKNDELVRQLADEKADHQSSLDALEIELAEANDRYVLLTDELWAVLGSEDRRDYVVQVKELVAELAEARKAAEWQEITPENMPGFDDEIGKYHPNSAGGWFEVSSDFVSHEFEDYASSGWTHFRPINPPPPEEPSK